ncbi:ATP-dependent RNA helicase [Plasmodiophora brassicae]|uniref:ATP-dependent RNA helicase n=1 Tax=Plasmodiophora brassicae TaxID=37360 RepID=A0A3P3YCT6_PLABS|nr:unnamed protein product [Plasmodiophora brassicae]
MDPQRNGRQAPVKAAGGDPRQHGRRRRRPRPAGPRPAPLDNDVVMTDAGQPPSPKRQATDARPAARSSSSSSSHMTTVSFASLPISSPSQQAISAMGFANLTQVQAQTLPRIMTGNDVLARAKTGTGKTVAFLLPCVEMLAKASPSGVSVPRQKVSVLVLSPTRELAQQIAAEAKALTQFHGFKVECVFGGSNVNREQARLRSPAGVDILVATPGRLLDHLKNSPGVANQLNALRVVVFDECDQLLDRGFQQDITKILGFLPPKHQRQTLLFSATVPDKIHSIVSLALRDGHDFIDTVGDEDTHTNLQVEQFSAVVPFDAQLAVLENVLRVHMKECPQDFKIIVFFPTARVVGFCAQLFTSIGLPVLEIHSRKSQAQRTKVSNQFREATRAIMFTSDVSARGVDYPDVTLIVQVGLTTREQYIHRVGRTARAGRQGKAVLLVCPFESAILKQLKDLPIQDISEVSAIARATMTPELRAAISGVPGNDAMVKAGSMAYQAFLGFYNSNTKMLGLSKEQLVSIANRFAGIIGLAEVPALSKKTIGMMGLKGTPGLVIDQHRQ